jgi:PEP-CTERM motif
MGLAGLVVLFTLGAQPARADTITVGGVSYTFSSMVDGSDPSNVYDVILTIDTTKAMASGTLSSFAVQFTGATNVAIESVSDNAGVWSAPRTGPNSANGCMSNPGNHWCASTATGLTVTAGGSNNGVYAFVFDVTMPNGTPLPLGAGIQAFQGQKGLAISVSNVNIPEPDSIVLLGSGLVVLMGLFVIRRRKFVAGDNPVAG